MRTAFSVRMAGLVASCRRCYNALTVWLTGNRLPPAYGALALEKTPPHSFLISIRRHATQWSLLNWLNFSKPTAKMAKRQNGIPQPPSASVARIGRPRRKKPPCVSEARLPPRSRHHKPTSCNLLRLLFLFPNPVCPLNRLQKHLKQSSLPRLSPLKIRSPKRRDAVRAAVAVAAAAIAGKPAPLPSRCVRLRCQPKHRFRPRLR